MRKAVIIIIVCGSVLLAGSFLFVRKNRTDSVTISNDVGNASTEKTADTEDILLKNESDRSETEETVPTAVPILMYHYIRDYSDPRDPVGVNLSVSPNSFDRQLEYLQANGFRSVAPDFFLHPSAISGHSIILTFDDGYEDAYTQAFPLLEKYKLSGVFYLIIDKVGTPGYLSWDEIRTMQAAGMIFGSHTLSHPDLTKANDVRMAQEIVQSKKLIEQNLGTTIDSFCYPSGKYDQAVEDAVRTAGYATALTTVPGIARPGDDPYALKRLRVINTSDISQILK